MAGAKLKPGTVKLPVLRDDHSATPTHLSRKKKSRKKKTKLLRYVIDHGPLLSRGILWEVCKWRIVAIGCCVAWYFNLSHVNDYSHSRGVRALTNISTKKKNRSSKCKHDLDIQKNQPNYYSKFTNYSTL